MTELYKHPEHYLNNDYENPKELFKFIGGIAEQYLDKERVNSILDVGCAKGEFLYYIKNRFQDCQMDLTGVDFSETLLNLARSFPGLDGVEFIQSRAEKFETEKQYDLVIATAIISYFEEPQEFLDKLFKAVKHGGVAIVTSGFATAEFDVMVRFRRFDEPEAEWLGGWSPLSIKGLERIACEYGKTLTPVKFDLPFSLEPQTDPLRSWTLDTADGQKFVNGLNQIWDVWSLIIK